MKNHSREMEESNAYHSSIFGKSEFHSGGLQPFVPPLCSPAVRRVGREVGIVDEGAAVLMAYFGDAQSRRHAGPTPLSIPPGPVPSLLPLAWQMLTEGGVLAVVFAFQLGLLRAQQVLLMLRHPLLEGSPSRPGALAVHSVHCSAQDLRALPDLGTPEG
jgi:hypothetical protein